MKSTKSVIITSGKETIKCSDCGSEKKFVLLRTPKNKVNPVNIHSESRMTDQQKYLAHIFEAQGRFGE